MRKSGSIEPVGSVASHSTSACAAFLRVRLQLPWPSPVSGSLKLLVELLHGEPFDRRWFTETVKRAPFDVDSKVWVSAGRLPRSFQRGSMASLSSLQAPIGVTFSGL